MKDKKPKIGQVVKLAEGVYHIHLKNRPKEKPFKYPQHLGKPYER